jgi:hypothetical protein
MARPAILALNFKKMGLEKLLHMNPQTYLQLFQGTSYG